MREVEWAARLAMSGRLVVLPTDTVYGIGTRPDRPEATTLLFEAKGRPRNLELPVLIPSPASAEKIAMVVRPARLLMEAFWPGPLTIVLSRGKGSAGWDLGGDPTTVGLRVPNHPVARSLLELTGPLAVTSANPSGRPTPAGCDEIRAMFGDAVECYLCDPAPLAGRPSTVVDLAHGEPTILRPGAVDEPAIWEALGAV